MNETDNSPDPTMLSYITPQFVTMSFAPGDPDQDMLAVPRWVLGVLAEELTAMSDCGGIHDEPGCARCDAIRVAKEANESGR